MVQEHHSGSHNPAVAQQSSNRRTFRQKIQRLAAPVEQLLAVEASSGFVLMLAALMALIWANSPLRQSYVALWHTPLRLRLGGFAVGRDLHFWINDGLMTLFFFVVGLEIRREMHAGELSEVRRAALPIAAAAGGMLVPAFVFAIFNFGRATAAGWAVPMATDIAFAVGTLALLGKRIPPALRILLLALAVIDDIGAIIVIALFYSGGIKVAGFVVLGIGMAGVWVQQRLGMRSPLAYVAPGAVIWFGAYWGGIHPTLAGVILGLMTPVRPGWGTRKFLDAIEALVSVLRSVGIQGNRMLLGHLDKLKIANREAVSPLESLQRALHRWVAFGIMPLFAFANAGVPLGQISFAGDAKWVFWGISLGLIVGKPVGIVMMSWLAEYAGIALLPRGVRWSHVGLVGTVGGIGFTMALFIAQLAFPAGGFLETAKLAILCGSGGAGLLALLVGRRILAPAPSGAHVAASEAEAEASTEL